MSVEITSGSFVFKPVLATNPLIPDNRYKPNKIMHEWLFGVTGTGDASGAGVYGNLDFGTFDKNHYITITGIYVSHVTSQRFTIKTDSDRWDNFYHPSQANLNINLYMSQADSMGINYVNSLDKILYLGRPRIKDTSPGLCQFVWSVNTNAEVYTCIIKGYTLERPLPYSSVQQP